MPSPSSKLMNPTVDHVKVMKDELIITYKFDENLRALTPNNSYDTSLPKLPIAALKNKLRKKVETLKTKNKKQSSNDSDAQTTIYKSASSEQSIIGTKQSSDSASFGYGSSITKLTNTTHLNQACNDSVSVLSSAISSNPTRTTLQSVLSGHALKLNQLCDNGQVYNLQTVQNPFYVSEDEDEQSSIASSYYPSYRTGENKKFTEIMPHSLRDKVKRATSDKSKGLSRISMVSSYNSMRAQYVSSNVDTDDDDYYANVTVCTQYTEDCNPFGAPPMLNFNTPIYSSDGCDDDDGDDYCDKLQLQRSLTQRPPQHSFNYFYYDNEREYSNRSSHSTQSTHI